ncbi:hypothetical protein EZV62_009020 [Acer yangbiense]|uniref:Retrovirus-related Pol polyprotein from transposon TNT 1-94 n=1 Tax=Acer yangbiense TaxID=1000413 RepID=A0A5C7IFG0_9ROSI|nr:hypothetical protein EZV62_009020 [Acer yangbiense]
MYSGIRALNLVITEDLGAEIPPVEESSNAEDSFGEEVSASETVSIEEQKDDMLEMALGTIILNLFDNVLREVNDETTAFNVWKKLEGLYLTKSLTNKVYLKERLFSFKMDPSKCLGQNLDEFKKMIIELANAGENEKLSDENEAIILLNSLLDSFKDVKAAIKYGRSSLSLEECISALKSKDLELKIERKSGGENLFARGRPLEKNNNQNSENKGRNQEATYSDGMHQVEEGQNQPEDNIDNLADYELVRDRIRRTIIPNIKFSNADFTSFALCTGLNIDDTEPRLMIKLLAP